MTVKSWDDIDLGGLAMETDENRDMDERSDRKERMDLEKLKKLVIGLGDTIPVEIGNPSANMIFQGDVKDISPHGIKVATTGKCEKGDIVRLVFSIGRRRMTLKAEVRWNSEDDQEPHVGMQFVNPDKRDVEFLTSIFTAMHLR